MQLESIPWFDQSAWPHIDIQILHLTLECHTQEQIGPQTFDYHCPEAGFYVVMVGTCDLNIHPDIWWFKSFPDALNIVIAFSIIRLF